MFILRYHFRQCPSQVQALQVALKHDPCLISCECRTIIVEHQLSIIGFNLLPFVLYQSQTNCLKMENLNQKFKVMCSEERSGQNRRSIFTDGQCNLLKSLVPKITINLSTYLSIYLSAISIYLVLRERHEQRHRDNDTFECEECHKFFKNEKNLRHHTKTHHDAAVTKISKVGLISGQRVEPS